MITRLLRRGGERRRTVESLHVAISEAARKPALYTGLGVPDTVEGRFECLCLHAVLVLRRLDALPAPAADVAQDLVDSLFRQLDASLRELGVGDLSVSKRMKKLASAFYGRASAYGTALDAGDREGLARGLARNVLGEEAADAGALAAYVAAADAALAPCDLDAVLAGPPFPDPQAHGSAR